MDTDNVKKRCNNGVRPIRKHFVHWNQETCEPLGQMHVKAGKLLVRYRVLIFIVRDQLSLSSFYFTNLRIPFGRMLTERTV